jgi:hypothetical protein
VPLGIEQECEDSVDDSNHELLHLGIRDSTNLVPENFSVRRNYLFAEIPSGCSKMCLVVGEDCDRGISERKFGRDCGLNPIHGFRALWHSSKRSCVMRRIVHAKRGMPVRSPKSSRGAAFVAMMQATNLRESDNVSRGGWVYGARFRTILVKREMGSGLVMILKIRVRRETGKE